MKLCGVCKCFLLSKREEAARPLSSLAFSEINICDCRDVRDEGCQQSGTDEETAALRIVWEWVSSVRCLTFDHVNPRDLAGAVPHEQQRQAARGFEKLLLLPVEAVRKRIVRGLVPGLHLHKLIARQGDGVD